MEFKNNVTSEGFGSKKRKSTDNDFENVAAPNKKQVTSYYFTLEKQKSRTTDEETDESVWSLQNDETVVVTDTSDTKSSNRNFESDVEIGIEFEINCDSDDNKYSSSSSSLSEPQDIAIDVVPYSNSDKGLNGDVSEQDSSDCGYTFIRYRLCLICEIEHNSLFPLCQECYEDKKAYHPRPQLRRKSRLSNKLSKNSKTTGIMNLVTPNVQEICKVDSGLGLQESEQIKISSQSPDSELRRNNDTFDSLTTTASHENVISSITSQKNEMTVQSQSSECTQEISEDAMTHQILNRLETYKLEGSRSPMLCIICYKNQRNSAFNHGATAHQLCCYDCAKKVCKLNSNRCPTCNRKIKNVTKIFAL